MLARTLCLYRYIVRITFAWPYGYSTGYNREGSLQNRLSVRMRGNCCYPATVLTLEHQEVAQQDLSLLLFERLARFRTGLTIFPLARQNIFLPVHPLS